MRPLYASKFSSLENRLEQLEKQVTSLSSDQFNLQKKPDTWSVSQVVQHLILVEKASLAYVKKKSSYPESLLDAGAFDTFRKFKLWLFMVAPLKVKAPKLVGSSHFRDGLSQQQLFREWRTERQVLRQFIENYPTDFDSKLTYKHPFAGRLTLDSMLYFIISHFDRHQKQIDRILIG